MIILYFCLWWYIIEGIYLSGMERRLRVIYVCVLDNRRGLVCLFISIVASAVGDVEPPVLHMINEAVFFVDATAVFALQVAGEGFRFPNPLHTAVPFDIPDELVDAL